MSERLLVCGTRTLRTHDLRTRAAEAITAAFRETAPGSVLIHGGARGVDTLAGFMAAQWRHVFVEVVCFPADWVQHGRYAGPIRNADMLSIGRPTRWLAVHTDYRLGRGTADMVRRLCAAGVPGRAVLL